MRHCSRALSVLEPLERRSLLSAAFQPDASFDGDGALTLDVLGHGDSASAVAVQPDGRILVTGYATDPADPNRQHGFVARLNPDGSKDGSFASNGVLVLSEVDGGDSLAVLTDGKILLGGHLTTGSGNATDSVLARLNADGSLDTSFANAGVGRADLSIYAEGFIRLAVEADGDIIAIARANFVPGHVQGNFGVARFHSDGTLDTSFGGDGTITTDFGHVDGHGFDAPGAVALLPEGKILVGGSTGDFAYADQDARDGGFAFARYNRDGSLDSSFGDGGLVTTRFADSDPTDWVTWGSGGVADLALLPDGKFLAAGTSDAGDVTLARYNPDGSLDTSYGKAGLATLDGYLASAYRVKLLDGGSVSVAGAGVAQKATFAMALFDGGGTCVDAVTWGPSEPVFHSVAAIAFDGDASLVTAGFVVEINPGTVLGQPPVKWETADVVVRRFVLGSAAQPQPGAEPVTPPVAAPAPSDPVPLAPRAARAARRQKAREARRARLQERRAAREAKRARRAERRDARLKARQQQREAHLQRLHERQAARSAASASQITALVAVPR